MDQRTARTGIQADVDAVMPPPVHGLREERRVEVVAADLLQRVTFDRGKMEPVFLHSGPLPRQLGPARHLVPLDAVELAPPGLGRASAPLLEEERGARALAAIADGPGPRR